MTPTNEQLELAIPLFKAEVRRLFEYVEAVRETRRGATAYGLSKVGRADLTQDIADAHLKVISLEALIENYEDALL